MTNLYQRRNNEIDGSKQTHLPRRRPDFVQFVLVDDGRSHFPLVFFSRHFATCWVVIFCREECLDFFSPILHSSRVSGRPSPAFVCARVLIFALGPFHSWIFLLLPDFPISYSQFRVYYAHSFNPSRFPDCDISA